LAGHNYYFWGPNTCTGQVLIGVGLPLADFQPTYVHVEVAATQTCEYCVSFEQHLPIVVASDPTIQDVLRLWPRAKHFE